MKLTSMVEFVLEKGKNLPKIETGDIHIMAQAVKESYMSIYRYANFLKQPLTLGIFVPCDKEENILTKPNVKNYGGFDSFKDSKNQYHKDLKKHQQAKERVIFKGVKYIESYRLKSSYCDYEKIEVNGHNIAIKHKDSKEWNFNTTTIEGMLSFWKDTTLTKTAQQQIGV